MVSNGSPSSEAQLNATKQRVRLPIFPESQSAPDTKVPKQSAQPEAQRGHIPAVKQNPELASYRLYRLLLCQHCLTPKRYIGTITIQLLLPGMRDRSILPLVSACSSAHTSSLTRPFLI